MESAVIKKSFALGYSPVICKEQASQINMDFGVLRLLAGEHYDFGPSLERAVLLLTGDVTFAHAHGERRVQRRSIFDDAPYALHLSSQQDAKVECHSDCEFAVIATENQQTFATEIFDHKTMIENEHRGRGLLDDTAYRMVRTIFDSRNRPQANLVLGEVITFPGRWSSYPPHFHAQPEIYHYRFTESQGYGHAELGENVYKVHHNDTLTILDNQTHSQVSAPGYGMYYLWAIRHLPDARYTTPTFVAEHVWTKEEGANNRAWRF